MSRSLVGWVYVHKNTGCGQVEVALVVAVAESNLIGCAELLMSIQGLIDLSKDYAAYKAEGMVSEQLYVDRLLG